MTSQTFKINDNVSISIDLSDNPTIDEFLGVAELIKKIKKVSESITVKTTSIKGNDKVNSAQLVALYKSGKKPKSIAEIMGYDIKKVYSKLNYLRTTKAL